MGWSFGLTGEAVVVEVAPGRFIFALLKGAGTTEYMGSVAADSTAGREGRVIDGALLGEVQGKPSRAAGAIAVPKAQYPLPVMFDDVARPGTVRQVDPEDLAAVFGGGVRLKAVTLEITGDAVTEGPVGTLPFWQKLQTQVTFSGLQFFDPEKPDEINYLTCKSMKMAGNGRYRCAPCRVPGLRGDDGGQESG